MAWSIDVRQLRVKRITKLGAVRPRMQYFVNALGNEAAGALLGINGEEMLRIIAGDQEITHELSRRLLAVDHVLARALLVFAPAALIAWLHEPVRTFRGAKPVEVLAERGASPLLALLDAVTSGCYRDE